MVHTITSGVKGVRLGLDEQYVTQDVDPELAEAVLAGVRVLESLGAEIVPVKLPDLTPYLAAWPTLCTAEAVAAHAATYPARRDDYGPWFRGWLDLGARVSGAAYAQAHHQRAACIGRLRTVWQQIDALACPSMPTPPFPVTPEALHGPMPSEGFNMARLRFTAPYDLNGAPTLSVPCGFTRDSLPLSLQFVGKPLGEPLLCRLGHAYEQVTTWHTMRPPV
jgi:amidase